MATWIYNHLLKYCQLNINDLNKDIQSLLKLIDFKDLVRLKIIDLVAIISHFNFNSIVLQETHNKNYNYNSFYKQTCVFLCRHLP